MPTDRMPIEDLKMRHVTRAHINPNMLQKLHDRGEDMTEKQWLSSNYSVEGKGRWFRADNDCSASAFILYCQEPRENESPKGYVYIML